MKKGFTLVEVILVIAIVSVIMVVLAQFFFSSSSIYRSQNSELGINFSTRVALDDIDAHVRQASIVADSYGVHLTDADTLVLDVPSINASEQMVPGAYDQVVIYLSGDKVFREIFPHANSIRESSVKLLAENVSSLAFTYNNAAYSAVTEVGTSLTVSKSDGRETRTISVSSKSYLRN